jgi:hypothetical protein
MRAAESLRWQKRALLLPVTHAHELAARPKRVTRISMALPWEQSRAPCRVS